MLTQRAQVHRRGRSAAGGPTRRGGRRCVGGRAYPAGSPLRPRLCGFPALLRCSGAMASARERRGGRGCGSASVPVRGGAGRSSGCLYLVEARQWAERVIFGVRGGRPCFSRGALRSPRCVLSSALWHRPLAPLLRECGVAGGVGRAWGRGVGQSKCGETESRRHTESRRLLSHSATVWQPRQVGREERRQQRGEWRGGGGSGVRCVLGVRRAVVLCDALLFINTPCVLWGAYTCIT